MTNIKVKNRKDTLTKTEETPHLVVVRKQWELKKLAAERAHFKAVNGEIVAYRTKSPAKLDKVLAAAAEEEKVNAIRTPQVGQTIPGHGVFVGIWEPQDTEGHSLGQVFNVFAAPQDLMDDSGSRVTLTFNEAVQHVAALKNWNGHDGGNFANEQAIYAALGNGSYHGEWFIPPEDILSGRGKDNEKAEEKTLYQAKEKGDFKDTFTNDDDTDYCARWYWSCTEQQMGAETQIRNARFDRDSVYVDSNAKELCKLSTRVVRVEPRHHP